MTTQELKKQVIDGKVAIFKVVSMQGQFLRFEVLDNIQLHDLLTEPNGERMADLLTFYEGQDVVLDNERYRLLCGYRLIAEFMLETAENIKDAVEETPDHEEELFDEYIDILIEVDA